MELWQSEMRHMCCGTVLAIGSTQELIPPTIGVISPVQGAVEALGLNMEPALISDKRRSETLLEDPRRYNMGGGDWGTLVKMVSVMCSAGGDSLLVP